MQPFKNIVACFLSLSSSDGYSSGYSDGGGGQDGVDNMVCDLADSDVEECDDVDVGAVCNDAQVDTIVVLAHIQSYLNYHPLQSLNEQHYFSSTFLVKTEQFFYFPRDI